MKFMANPVLRREITSRMRSWRAPGLLSLYVGLLGLVTIFILTINNSGFSPTMAAVTFNVIVTGQFVLLLFAAPGMTAGAISGERERQTLDLILTSPLSRSRIVVGKLLSALAFQCLLLTASMPLYGLMLYLGGLSLGHVLLAMAVQLVTCLWVGALGLYFSSVFKKTIPAMVVTYAVTGAATAGYTLASLAVRIYFETKVRLPNGGQAPLPAWFKALGYLNPLSALFDAAGGPVQEFLSLYRSSNFQSGQGNYFPYWPLYLVLSVGLMALLIWRTTRRLGPSKTGL